MSTRLHHRPVPGAVEPACTAPPATCRRTPGARRSTGRLLGTGLVGVALVATA